MVMVCAAASLAATIIGRSRADELVRAADWRGDQFARIQSGDRSAQTRRRW
jgi:hypothetical protein